MKYKTEPKTPRALLAAIVLTGWPIPTGIQLSAGNRASLAFGTIADGLEWARFLGAKPAAEDGETTYINENGKRYILVHPIEWNGWRVHLWACGPDVVPDGLSDDERAALEGVS